MVGVGDFWRLGSLVCGDTCHQSSVAILFTAKVNTDLRQRIGALEIEAISAKDVDRASGITETKASEPFLFLL